MPHEKTRFIKVRVECILPVPFEVRDALDAVAESGLDAMRQLIEANVTTLVPGSVVTSWQSMPQSWQPRRSNVVLEERLNEDVSHQLERDPDTGEESVRFVDITDAPLLELDEARERAQEWLDKQREKKELEEGDGL